MILLRKTASNITGNMAEKNKASFDMMTLADKTAMSLREDIQQGKYAVGEKLSDEHGLAEKFDVSRGTIRQALTILEKEKLITRHQGRGTFVAHPGQSISHEAGTAIIGAVVFGSQMIPQQEYFFGAILESAFPYASSRGYILATGSNHTAETEKQTIETFINSDVKGVVLAPLPDHSHSAYDKLIEKNIPVVLLDTILPGRNEDFVGIDNIAGTELATQHLIDLGHTQIAYIGDCHPERTRSQWERFMGFLGTCKKSGLEIPKSCQLEVDEENCDNQIHKFLNRKKRPTAIVAFNDIWALRVMTAAAQNGIKVPEDLSVVGFDDSFLSKTGDITITTINPKPDEVGSTVIDLLINKIENPDSSRSRSILIPPLLVEGQSTAKPPGN